MGYPKIMDGLFHGSKPYEQMDDLGGCFTPYFWKHPNGPPDEASSGKHPMMIVFSHQGTCGNPKKAEMHPKKSFNKKALRILAHIFFCDMSLLFFYYLEKLWNLTT